GYVVSNVAYTVDPAGSITQVAFDLDAAANSASASVHTGDPLSPCVHGLAFHWTCAINVTAASADLLRVVAY
ncbi:MAG: hypothetical protein ACXVP1_06095, partial [Thermoleophilia bacterium]